MGLPKAPRAGNKVQGTYRPKRNAVKIRQFLQKEITDGGIVIPEAFRIKQNWGEVLEIGDMVEGIQVGETVMFPTANYPKYSENGQEVIIVPSHNILVGK